MESSSPLSTILLVERDADVRAVIREILITEGYELILAPNARGALPLLLRLERLGLILLERSWREDTGPEQLVNIIRSLPSLAAVPIVLIDVTRRDVPPGAQAILRKPFTLETLLNAVKLHCLVP